MDMKSGFLQFVADNADVNVCTLDGLNTFHSMGMIQCVTPKVNNTASRGIFRITDVPSATVLGNFGHIPIQTFEKQITATGLHTIKVKQIENSNPIPRASDILWIYGKMNDFPRLCGWNGFMEEMTASKQYSTSDVIALPFVNAPPSDYNTIYTTLLIAAKKCRKTRQQTCITTFDQPLYQKAREIVSSCSDPLLKSVIVDLEDSTC